MFKTLGQIEEHLGGIRDSLSGGAEVAPDAVELIAIGVSEHAEVMQGVAAELADASSAIDAARQEIVDANKLVVEALVEVKDELVTMNTILSGLVGLGTMTVAKGFG
ncbi:hypothetical protein [Actinomycetospora sp. CA-053990]|uniref:hypothetical protein n=1 Tax=Actinomycetospora sp. CA-053990 TaxID=3239891 RepID=UPI003D8BFAF2